MILIKLVGLISSETTKEKLLNSGSAILYQNLSFRDLQSLVSWEFWGPFDFLSNFKLAQVKTNTKKLS